MRNTTRMNQCLAAALATLLLGSLGGCAASQRTNFAPVMEPEAFAQHAAAARSARGPVIVDMRSAEEFARSHVAGSRLADPTIWKEESLADETGLSHKDIWHQRIGAMGICGTRSVVIYDDGRMTEAARLWFILQHFGAGDVAVVNGGFRAIEPMIAAGRVEAGAGPAAPHEPVPFRPASDGAIGLVDREAVRRAVEQREAQIFDARSAEEFTGQDKRRNARGGHLPTAINVPHRQLLDAQGRLRPAEELGQILAQAGFERGRPVITHCDGGGRASLAALAAQQAGYGPVLNYYLSFGDWAADATCPVESGE